MIDNIKAFAADIDMTLAAKGSELPEVTMKAFDVMHENGILLGLATGRELNDRLYNQGKEWGMSYPFDFLIGMNGGMIYDRAKDRTWIMDLMTCEELREVLEYMMPLVDKYEVSVNVEGGGNHAAMYIKGELFASMKRRGWKFDDCTGNIDAFCSKPCFKILFRTTPDVEKMIRERVHARYADKYQCIGTFPGTVEVMQKGITKGTGLKMFAEWNDIPLENIITFGDNENDNSLLETAGWGVALADGSEDTKAIADDVTDYGCLEGGVGHYLIDRYLRPKGLI